MSEESQAQAAPAPEPSAGVKKSRESAEALPYETIAILSVFTRPYRSFEIVLSGVDRLARTIGEGTNAILLVGVLFYTSILFALPYGAILDINRFWRISLLFAGSLAICFPSLHISAPLWAAGT